MPPDLHISCSRVCSNVIVTPADLLVRGVRRRRIGGFVVAAPAERADLPLHWPGIRRVRIAALAFVLAWLAAPHAQPQPAGRAFIEGTAL